MNRDEVPLEALWVINVGLVRIRAMSGGHLSAQGTASKTKRAHVSFHTARCLIPSARDVQ